MASYLCNSDLLLRLGEFEPPPSSPAADFELVLKPLLKLNMLLGILSVMSQEAAADATCINFPAATGGSRSNLLAVWQLLKPRVRP